MDVFWNPKNSGTLIFLMKEDMNYSLVEVNFLRNSVKDICTYTITSSLKFIKLAEDLSQVFIVMTHSQTEDYL